MESMMPFGSFLYMISPSIYQSILGDDCPQKWLDISRYWNILLMVFIAVLPVSAYAFLALSSQKHRLELERRLKYIRGVGPVQVYFTASSKYLDSIIVLIWRNNE